MIRDERKQTYQEVGSVGVERSVDRGSSGRSPLERYSLVGDGGDLDCSASIVFLDQITHSELDQIKREEPRYQISRQYSVVKQLEKMTNQIKFQIQVIPMYPPEIPATSEKGQSP